MKVLLRKNVAHLGKIGDIVDVKPGYARNYLVPQRLAVEPTKGNLKAIEAEKQTYLEELAKQKAQIEAKAALVQGKEVTIAVRANEEGHLYGSVGPAQISSALAEMGAFIEAEFIHLDAPIEQLDKYDVKVNFGEDVSATVHVWVVPVRDAGLSDDDVPAADDVLAETDTPPEAPEETPPEDLSDAGETA